MNSYKNTPDLKVFNQKLYQGYNFYYCDDNHPFIAFTTCFCPLCEQANTIDNTTKELLELETAYDLLDDKYMELVGNAMIINPELLL